MGGKKLNLIGNKFGRLTVIKPFGKNKWGKSRFLCKCECGNICIKIGTVLKRGDVNSCGCLQREIAIKRNTKHGKSGTKIYQIWQGMIDRCCNSNSKYYANYGGRGITICDEWRHSFECFYKDMGERPNKMSIDRIDNNKGYSKENCRWATRIQQENNKTTNILISHNGENHSIADWARITGINKYTLYNRNDKGEKGERLFRAPDKHGFTKSPI